MLKRLVTSLLLASVAIPGLAHAQSARDYISIVGSSTVFPFSSVVAEHFGKSNPKFKTPKVESTGTGGGFKLFCEGIGAQYPDIANASRRIKPSELEQCAKNGVKDVVEIKIGYDGILIATKKGAPAYKLTRKDLFLAVAKQVPDPAKRANVIANPYKTWRQIDAALPDVPINVFGPAPNHGTRDAFVELALNVGCEQFASLKALKKTDENRYKQICSQVREDGAWTDVSEDYALVMGKLASNSQAMAVFTFSYLDQNREKLSPATVDGVAISIDTIASGVYPLSRPLFFYVKKAHVGVIPGIREFIGEFTSAKAMGADGYLVERGLIPMPAAELKGVLKDAKDMRPVKL
ncbi:MAG TPA: substrate-binding domain-containing protein [Steroidobacteraceae bacterium]|nr:substrate-binding domain-containing protein [Steroidobacteraceae bacterium]